MEDRIREMELRLERAEREVLGMRRIARVLGGVVVSGLACGALFLATAPAASQLQAANAIQGATRLKAPLVITDGRGRPVIQVVANAQARGIIVFDTDGNSVAGVGQNGDGKGVAVFDPDGDKVIGLGVSALGRGLTVFDTTETTAAWVGVGNPGPAQGRGLLVSDETGAHVAKIGVVDAPDRGTVEIKNREGTVLFEAP